MSDEMIHIDTDIKIRFPEIAQQVRQLVFAKTEEFEAILKTAVANFDFATALKKHIDEKLTESIDNAFEEIDLTEDVKGLIFTEISKRLALIETN